MLPVIIYDACGLIEMEFMGDACGKEENLFAINAE